MTLNLSGWLPNLLGPIALKVGGVTQTARAAVNWVGVTATDDEANDQTIMTVVASALSLGAGVATFLATPSSANLRAALTDETGTGAAVFAGSPTLATPVINGQTQGAAIAVSAMAIDWSLGAVFTKTLAAGANVFTFSNQASGMVIVVRVTGAASTLTWPAVLWAGGVAPTQTASGTDIYTFVHDGTSIYGSVVQAMA
ncbi:MAG TPA: hypothetical protein PK141_00525 [Polyangiaceae bacterium]|nr:hypothetical protein [Polyangiaceae bacterium]